MQILWWPQMKCQHAEMQREHRIANYGTACGGEMRREKGRGSHWPETGQCWQSLAWIILLLDSWAPSWSQMQSQSQSQSQRLKRVPLDPTSAGVAAKCLLRCVTLSTKRGQGHSPRALKTNATRRTEKVSASEFLESLLTWWRTRRSISITRRAQQQ